MPRIRPLAENEVAPEVRAFYEQDRAHFGRVLNSTGIYAYAPQWLALAKQLGPAIDQSTRVPPALRALVNLFVARRIGCPS